MMMDWTGRRILVIGAARQGLALTRFLVHRRAQVILNDNRPAESMHAAQEALDGLPVRWELGGHHLSLLDERVDLICVSGGVPLTLPLIVEARKKGIPISNDSQIFMETVPCKVIGITGSAGKTTTTTLVGRMAEAGVQVPARSWVGGNIGLPLVEYLDEIQPIDLVTLELSSFQLEIMTRVPQVGAILNITPNHLDRHGTMEAYTAAKARLIACQSQDDVAILNREDPGSWKLAGSVPGRLITFGVNQPPAGLPGTFLDQDLLKYSDGSDIMDILPREMILLRGQHNLINVLAACAIGIGAGLPVNALQSGVDQFHGVPHRLERVRVWHGVEWYNDSIATAPERTMAAIRAFDTPLVLLLGGRDKNLPWQDLAALVHLRVDHVILFGEAAEKIQKALDEVSGRDKPYTLHRCNTLFDAVQSAAAVAEPGDCVLLSPGGTSYDEFKDFEERGERYRSWVHQLA